MAVPCKSTIVKGLNEDKPMDSVFFCDSCLLENKKISAEGFCKTCEEYLCETCFKYHVRLLASKNHVVIIKSQTQTKAVNQKDEDVLEEECDIHEGKIIEYYCQTCDKVKCIVCVTTSHEGHEVVYIPEFTKGLDEEDFKKNIKDDVNIEKFRNESNGSKVKEIPLSYKWTLELQAEHSRDMLKMYRKEINETIDKLELHLEQKIKNKEGNDFAMLDTYSQKLSAHMDKLQLWDSSLSCFSRSFKTARNKKFVISKLFPEAFTKFTECKQSLLTHLKKSNDYGIEEEICLSLKHLVNKPKHDKQTVKLRHEGFVDVKKKLESLEDGKPISKCCISACIAISDERLILNDSENNNVILCRIKETRLAEDSYQERNDDMDVISMKSVDSSPWDITQIDDTEVAITLPLRKRIQFLVIRGNTIKDTKSIAVRDKCYGLAYLEGTIYVSFNYTEKVEIIDRDGKVLGTVSSSFRAELPPFKFSSPKYITCDKDRKLVFISDEGNDCIAVCSGGRIKAVIQYTSRNLDREFYYKWMRRPLAMAVDKSGGLLVAVDWPFSVQRVSPDFLEKNVLVQKGCAWGIHSIASYQNKLYFGTNCGHLYVSEIKHA